MLREKIACISFIRKSLFLLKAVQIKLSASSYRTFGTADRAADEERNEPFTQRETERKSERKREIIPQRGRSNEARISEWTKPPYTSSFFVLAKRVM